METGIYFFALMAGVAALHLITTAVNAYKKTTRNSETEYTTTRRVKDDDWYMFFHVSDLVGKKVLPKTPSNTTTVSNQRKKSQKRPALRRM